MVKRFITAIALVLLPSIAGAQRTVTGVTMETEREVRAELGAIVSAAVSGDVGAMVGAFAKDDRDRFNAATQQGLAVDQNALDLFKQQWYGQFKDQNTSQTPIPYAITAAKLKGGQAQKQGARGRMSGRSESYQQRVTVTVPSGQVTGGSIGLVNEGTKNAPNWKIDVPAELSPEQLRNSLNAAFNRLNNTALPADRQQAETLVAAQIFRALNGQL